MGRLFSAVLSLNATGGWRPTPSRPKALPSERSSSVRTALVGGLGRLAAEHGAEGAVVGAPLLHLAVPAEVGDGVRAGEVGVAEGVECVDVEAQRGFSWLKGPRVRKFEADGRMRDQNA